MELPIVEVKKSGFVETATGNKVSRETTLCGTQNIIINGRSILMGGCVIRGDLANIRMGRFCIIKSGSVIRPPHKKFPKGVAYVPQQMGDHVIVEEDSIVVAAVVGSFVHIGKGAIIGPRCILKDACYILPGSVVPADTVVPPLAVLGGNPATLQGHLPPVTQELVTDASTQLYHNFRLVP